MSSEVLVEYRNSLLNDTQHASTTYKKSRWFDSTREHPEEDF
jgi:hypothetical protein